MRISLAVLWVLFCVASVRGQGAVRLYNEAVEYYVDGAYQQAEEHVKLALKIQKTYPDAWFLLGQCHREEGKYRKALKMYKKALKLTPTEPDYLYHRALAYEEWGKIKKAVEAYRTTTEVDPGYALAYDHLAAIYMDARAFKTAYDYYSRSIKALPMQADSYMRRALAAYKADMYAACIDDCNKTLAIDPEHAGAYSQRARARFQNGELMEAVNDYSQVLDRLPQDADAHLNRGVALLVLGLRPQAEEDLLAAVALDSSLVNGWWNLAVLHYEQGAMAKARTEVQKATSLYALDAEAWLLQGRIAFSERDYPAALHAYDRAIVLDRELSEAYLYRGEAKRVLEDMKGACKDWNRVLQLDDGVHAEKAENWILINCE